MTDRYDVADVVGANVDMMEGKAMSLEKEDLLSGQWWSVVLT